MTASKRFLVCSGVRGDTRRYRTIHLYEQLCLLGADCRLARLVDFDLPRLLDQPWEMVFFHRVAYDSYINRLLDAVQRRGGIAVFDCDDLIFDPAAFQWINSPEFADRVRSNLFRDSMSRVRRTLDACGAATTSTDFLAEQVCKLGKPVWVHRNAFSLEMLSCSEQAYQKRRPQPGRVVIGYASGTPTHNLDFELVKPAIQQVLARCPQAELWLVGPLDPGSDWGGLADRIHRFSLVPWRSLPGVLAQFDINLAPLVADNPFSQSKSEIKYVEAALVRSPTVASPTDAFRFAILSGKNGFLAASVEEWTAQLVLLAEDEDLRAQMGATAYADALARYHPAVRAVQLAATINAIHRQLKGSPVWDAVPSVVNIQQGKRPVSGHMPGDPSNFRLGLYSLLHSSWRMLVGQVWIYLRRLLAPIFPFQKN
jgi:glycosyltransferase involved in cell wall biosynthesis